MAENTQRSTGRQSEYKFDRGGMPAEMGPFIGIVVNNVDNTRTGRLQVWIEQFGATNVDGSPNLTDPTVWRTVRYITPFYGATQQSGATGVGSYPGNRNSYGMWFTPPELGTRVLCFFAGGDPTVGGYYIGCIPEDGMNHMIPAIGASSNYQSNNSAQQEALNGATAAPVTEINDIDPAFIDNPKFWDQKKPVQSSVESVLVQQGLQKDPIRGPIKSSAQRESPSNCYGISTPGKPIYQGGATGGAGEKTFKDKLEKGQVRLEDIAVIGRQGGHTFVMDDGDLQGNDTLVRIRTAKGHQITMSDDGDAFYIIHANGQTWLEFGKQGTVDVYSTNSINLRTEGVLNFHADQGINMYSGKDIKIKSKTSTFIDSVENIILNSEKSLTISSKTTTGIRSDGTLALDGKTSSWKSGGTLNLQGSVINLNGASTVSVPAVKALTNFKLADTAYTPGQGWVVKEGSLETIVTRAPTHEPYPGHGLAADTKTNLNPTTFSETTGGVAEKYSQVSARSITDGVTIDSIATEPASPTGIGTLNQDQVTALTAQTAQYHASQFPPYDDQGVLQVGWAINGETGEPYYIGTDIGSATRGVGKYGQSVDSLVSLGLVKSGVADLIKSGISPELLLKSDSSWTGKLGINNLLGYLQNPTIQNIAQIGLATSAFLGLQSFGVITGSEAPRILATLLQPATEYGVESVVQWVDGVTIPSETVANLEIAARQGQYSVDFVDAYSAEINAQATVVEITDATDRTVIDQAVAELIGDPKVPIPQYTNIETALVNDTTTVIQSDGIVKSVPVTQVTTADDGTFRFAPGNKQG